MSECEKSFLFQCNQYPQCHPSQVYLTVCAHKHTPWEPAVTHDTHVPDCLCRQTYTMGTSCDTWHTCTWLSVQTNIHHGNQLWHMTHMYLTVCADKHTPWEPAVTHDTHVPDCLCRLEHRNYTSGWKYRVTCYTSTYQLYLPTYSEKPTKCGNQRWCSE